MINLLRHKPFLELLGTSEPDQQQALLETATAEQVHCLCLCVENVMKRKYLMSKHVMKKLRPREKPRLEEPNDPLLHNFCINTNIIESLNKVNQNNGPNEANQQNNSPLSGECNDNSLQLLHNPKEINCQINQNNVCNEANHTHRSATKHQSIGGLPLIENHTIQINQNNVCNEANRVNPSSTIQENLDDCTIISVTSRSQNFHTQHSATKHQGVGGLPLFENHTTQIQIDRDNQGQSSSLNDIGKKARSIFKPSPKRNRKNFVRDLVKSKCRSHVKFNCIEINTHQVKKCPLPSSLVSNVCHITNKVTELSAVISNNKSTINLIVESWLTDDVPNSFINIGDNYLIFRLDRPTPGGGVLAYIDKSVPVSRLPNLEEAGKEHYCDDLTPVIHSIVTGSITQSKYPTAYKHAIVTPVPKIHQPKDINNDLRQISVLPHLAKMIEKIQLELNSHDLAIKDNQHAFVKNRSTVSALISMTQKWFDVTDNSNIGRKGVHTTFLDFKKAFDLVDHRILLIKLAEMNVSKAFWSWVKCFLTERNQHVNLHGVISSSAPCPAGVPQGSVISPTLFNIHINDLENTLTNNLTNTHKYTDDCTLDEVVANGALSNMQESTNQVMNWANDNKMMVNPKKTKDMWISFSQSSSEPPTYTNGWN
ncbi:Hypothetical predicted protein [Paramuricea clavata]|uniref:Uncharacterized protein n=1 Tax=Paramuricea clavata TaxID=317549 RepID=A0A7D9JT07_PARCT|nr:Hypothetical predicted protein [Paramuricea clavata]